MKVALLIYGQIRLKFLENFIELKKLVNFPIDSIYIHNWYSPDEEKYVVYSVGDLLSDHDVRYTDALSGISFTVYHKRNDMN